MVATTYSKSGNKAATAVKLEKSIFGVEVKNHDLLKEAYLAYLANGRTNSAITKTRGEVQGGGRKPWRQKGTGRARFGSSRNPIWRGGGVAFGPTGNENYSHKLSPATKRQALRQALSLAATEDRIKVVESLAFPGGKTKSALSVLSKIGSSGMTLIVCVSKDEPLERATRNLAEVKLVKANYLSVFDILNADNIVIDANVLEFLHEWLGTGSSK